MTSLLWADQIIQEGKVVLQGMCGRLGVMEKEVAISLSQLGRFDVRNPKWRVWCVRSF